MEEYQLKYLQSLANQYPTIASAATEIINLQSILNLPKGTEHFITDIHGEYEQFQHVLRNGSGSVKRKIDDEFGTTFSNKEKKSLATLIYYPEQKLKQLLKEEEANGESVEDWYRITINRLIRIIKRATSKYSRSKVRKALPKDFAYVIEELVTERFDLGDKEAYFNEIINTIIEIGRAQELIIAMCNLIKQLVVDHLHVIGDIFDRGPAPHIIMDMLMDHHSVDIQWGNHDVLWMGAAAGQVCNIATLLRISAKYGNLYILEESYGINLIPLERFAMSVYQDDPCNCFKIDYRAGEYNPKDAEVDRKMHKAIAVIQFKLEGQLIRRRPEFHMEDRLLLDKMELEKGIVTIEGQEYPLKDIFFPTINKEDPYALTPEEADVVERLRSAFVHCEKLQKHIRFLYAKGNMYKVYNDNLLYHGCVPLNSDGTFKKVNVYGTEYSGKALFDVLESYARKGYYALDSEVKQKGLDILWYTWIHENSPLFGKSKMTTFERYFIADKKTHTEPKNPYYSLLEDETVVNRILEEFGLGAEGCHIVNGHVPVESKRGESPVKCGGKLLSIDGGFSKAYQSKTGIAGYTLTYNSYGLLLVAHEPFESMEQAILNESDIHSDTVLVQNAVRRRHVADTDVGRELAGRISDLKELLKAYRAGKIVEKIV